MGGAFLKKKGQDDEVRHCEERRVGECVQIRCGKTERDRDRERER